MLIEEDVVHDIMIREKYLFKIFVVVEKLNFAFATQSLSNRTKLKACLH